MIKKEEVQAIQAASRKQEIDDLVLRIDKAILGTDKPLFGRDADGVKVDVGPCHPAVVAVVRGQYEACGWTTKLGSRSHDQRDGASQTLTLE